MGSWKGFTIGLIVGLAAVVIGVFCYFRFGFAPVAVTSAPMPFEIYLSHKALHVTTSAAANDRPTIEPNETNLMAGAQIYRSSCAACHSLPGRGKTDFEKGMYPRPPELLSGKGVTDDPVGETHWVVEHGIRMTGMPGFAGSLSSEQLWQVSLLLAHAHELPAAVQAVLQQPDSVPIANK